MSGPNVLPRPSANMNTGMVLPASSASDGRIKSHHLTCRRRRTVVDMGLSDRPVFSKRMSDWWCATCEFKIFGHKEVCSKCGARRPGVGAAPAVAVKPGDWTCAGCGLNNFATRRACFKCAKPKPGLAEGIVTESAAGCCICMTAQATLALVPCGHLCVCGACQPQLGVGKTCPLCRQVVAGHQIIFQ